MQPDLSSLLQTLQEPVTDGCCQMSSSMLPNVIPALGSSSTATLFLTAGANTSDNAYGLSSLRPPHYAAKDGGLHVDLPKAETGIHVGALRRQQVGGVAHVLDVDSPVSCSSESRGPTSALSPGDVVFRGHLSATRPMGHLRTEGSGGGTASPGRGSLLPRSTTLPSRPPGRLQSPQSRLQPQPQPGMPGRQQPSQSLHSPQPVLQREILVLPVQESPPGLGTSDSGADGRHQHQYYQQQQQQQQQQLQQHHQHHHYHLPPATLQASPFGSGVAPASSTTSGGRGTARRADCDDGGGDAGGGADDVMAWDLTLGQCDSMAGDPSVRLPAQPPGAEAAVGSATAAAPPPQPAPSGAGAGAGTSAAAAGRDAAPRAAGGGGGGKSHRNTSQVLLPPLLMRAAAANGSGGGGDGGGEVGTVFFGPGALPGLLNGSSPPETGLGGAGIGGGGGQGGTRLLAGPMFLHIAPNNHSRQQVSGMVPTLVPVLPTDDSSMSLWGGASASGTDATPSVNCGASAFPSSAAALASSRIVGLGGNAASVAAAAAEAAAAAAGTAAAAAAPSLSDLEGIPAMAPAVATSASDGDAKLRPQSPSWIVWSSALTKSSGLHEAAAAAQGGSRPSSGKASAGLSPCLSAPPEAASRGVHDGGTGGGAAATVAAAGTLPAKAPHLSYPDGNQGAVGQFRSITTCTQHIPMELDTTSVLQDEAQCAGTSGGGGGGAEADAELTAAAGGWLTPDGDGGGAGGASGSGSRRVGRGPSNSVGAKAVAAGHGLIPMRERGSSSSRPAVPEAAGGGGGGGPETPAMGRSPAHGGAASAAAGATPTPGPSVSSAVAAAALAARVPSPPSRPGSHHLKKSAVRPLSASEMGSGGRTMATRIGGGGGGGSGRAGGGFGGGGGGGDGSVASYGDAVSGSPDSGAMAPESPKARWQRAARAAGLAASVARGFRTLRNQHDENLVREEQLEVLSEIGAGSFARVDKCRYHPRDGATPFLVAVKRIKPEMLVTSRDPEDLQLFIQEAQLLRKLNHPHIVQYVGMGIVAEEPGSCQKRPMDAEQLLELSRRSWGPPVRRHHKSSSSGHGTRQLDRKRSAAGGRPPPPPPPRGAKGGACCSSDEEDAAAAAGPGGPQSAPAAPPLPLVKGVFIVEEYLAGGTLKTAVYQQMLRPQKQLYTNATALCWMGQVAAALSYMHTCRPKVLHRDIKLDNVLLQPPSKAKESSGTATSFEGCTAKLGDLGLAALLSHHRRHSGIGASDLEVEEADSVRPANARTVRSQASVAVRQRVTAAAQAPPHLRQANDASRLSKMLESHKRDRLGTYMYMAPEVYQRQKYDEKCDCFSFAMLLYEVFHRFITACSLEHSSEMEKYARQVSQGFRPAIHEDLPQPLRRLIKECWAQDPADRPDMAAVARELRALQARGVVTALDRKQQAASGMLGSCCCVVS